MKIVKTLLAAAVLAGAAVFLPAAHAQVYSPTLFTATNLPGTLSSNVVSVTTNIFPLTKNCCLSLTSRFQTSAGAGTGVISGSFSQDGTNFGCAPFTLTGTLSTAYPTNAITAWTNFSQAQLSGFSAINITTFTNTGPGVCTNFGVQLNRATLNTATF